MGRCILFNLNKILFPCISNRFCKGPLKFDREGRTKNIEKLKDLIERRKPRGIAIAAENVDSTRILKTFQEAILELEMDNRIRRDIDLKLVDEDVVHVLSNFEMAENEFSGQSLYPNVKGKQFGRVWTHHS
uniref:YqgF domain-containing protein n=1 Tax=Rhabditophanes sp. KR3021 TaxID=114890 RepID=A0AC35TW45_9BILA